MAPDIAFPLDLALAKSPPTLFSESARRRIADLLVERWDEIGAGTLGGYGAGAPTPAL